MYFGLIFRSACNVAAIAVALCALGGAASSDDAALSALKDEIFARKILMDSIDSHMDAIDWMVSSGKAIDMPKAVEHAETISIMLMAFSHLFPASSNQWRPNAKRNPGRDTFAAPELWANYGRLLSAGRGSLPNRVRCQPHQARSGFQDAIRHAAQHLRLLSCDVFEDG